MLDVLTIACLTVRLDLQTVICQGPSGSRYSVAAAKLQLPADASMTLCWRPLALANKGVDTRALQAYLARDENK